MAFTALRCVSQMKSAVFRVDQTRNLINYAKHIAPSTIRHRHQFTASADKRHKKPKDKFYGTSESESDRDLEEKRGHRGNTNFWYRKMATIHKVLDVNKDGVLSYDDFKLFGERFIELGHLSEKHTKEARKLLDNLWEKRWGPISPYNVVPVEKFIEDMRHVVNDPKLVRRAHCFLPYLFKAIDKDQSGEVTFEEFKLFHKCLGLDHEFTETAFNFIDTDGDGIITMREFVKKGREFLLHEDHEQHHHFFGALHDSHTKYESD